jgi:hypothetical protein
VFVLATGKVESGGLLGIDSKLCRAISSVSVSLYVSVIECLCFRRICENIGAILRKAYTSAEEVALDDDDETVKRSDIAFQIFRPLMEHCILVKRQHADKFCMVGL